MTLYEINKQIEGAIDALLASVDEETGEVNEDAKQALEQLQADRAEKLDNIGAFIKNLTVEVEALKEEAKALKERAEQKERKIQRLKNYVEYNLLAAGESGFESTRVKFSFRKSVKVEIRDAAIIPKKFLTKKVTFDPDKNAIKAVLMDGKKVKGAELVTNQNLQIK